MLLDVDDPLRKSYAEAVRALEQRRAEGDDDFDIFFTYGSDVNSADRPWLVLDHHRVDCSYGVANNDARFYMHEEEEGKDEDRVEGEYTEDDVGEPAGNRDEELDDEDRESSSGETTGNEDTLAQ